MEQKHAGSRLTISTLSAIVGVLANTLTIVVALAPAMRHW